MTPMLVGALAGGGLGLLQSIFGNGQANREKELQARTAQYSPWTGLRPQSVETPNPISTMLGGIGSGIGLGQNIQQANLLNEWLKKKIGGGQGQNMSPWSQISETGGMNS